MNSTPSYLLDIIARASSLSQRLNEYQPDEIAATRVDKAQINDRLMHWQQIVAPENWEKFQKRLQWDGLSLEQVHCVLGSAYLPDDQTLPEWAKTLEQIVMSAEQCTPQSKFKSSADPNDPLPFEDILLPIVQIARKKFLTCLGSISLSLSDLPLELLTEPAYLALERSLLARLVNLCMTTLESEFSQSRPEGRHLLHLLFGEISGKHKKIYYNAFVKRLLSDRLLSFFELYPVLARLVAISVDFWVEAMAEFLMRLQIDLPAIQHEFICPALRDRGDTELGKVSELQASLSDPHNNGRSVIALRFESGLKVIYKPKDLSLDVVYQNLLQWCNQNSALLPFKILKVLNRSKYGWVEYVSHHSCEDEMDIQNFYQRAGMLLCLLYVLGGTDCHQENLVACGEHFVLVDTEALLHHDVNPTIELAEITEIVTGANRQFWDSVLRTGLLPHWDFGKDNRIAYDTSGLGSIDAQRASWQAPRWKFVNTDDMHLLHETGTMPVHANVPMLNGKIPSPNAYVDELVAGFQEMYRFLMNQRAILFSADSPLLPLRNRSVRFVFRATRVYGAILQKSLMPQFLRNGMDWSIELDLLSRAFLTSQQKPNTWLFLQTERKAMEQLDIPYFVGDTASDVFTFEAGQQIEHYFMQPSYEQCLLRLQRLDDADLTRQVSIIRDAFHARVARSSSIVTELPFDDVSIQHDHSHCISPVNSAELFKEAQLIAQQIQERAILGVDSSVNWIGLSYVPNADCFQLQPYGANLYDGRCGVALFLTALDYARGDRQFRGLALSSLQALRKILQTQDAEHLQRFARQLGIGGAIGLGSVIYAFIKISQFTQETTLLEDATRVAELITSESIASDIKFDVMEGVAGTILGLLALHEETTDPKVLAKAIACGEHLLMHQISFKGYPKAWKAVLEQPQTGFSHGAAGIAYALLRLYAATHKSTYLQAAIEGIAYERSVFVPSIANWPHFSSTEQQEQPEFRVSWCGGAPGIGLARLGGLSIWRTDEILEEIEIALETTQAFSWYGVDHLCCGNFGRIDMLLVAAQQLSQPHWREIVCQRTTCLVERSKQTGGYQLFGNLPNSVFNPGLFQGMAGIGYELLRIAMPEKLPSILLWE